MILQRLVNYYDRLRTSIDEDAVPRFGFSRERISFELVIDRSTGQGVLNDLRKPVQYSPKKEAVLEARWMTVPYRGDRSSNVKANFLWDNTGYVFGRSKKTSVETKKHQEFLKLHRELRRLASDDSLEAVLQFFQKWNPESYTSFPLANEALEQNVVFRLRGEHSYVHESAVIQEAWSSYFTSDTEKALRIDLVDGQPAQVAATHFLVGGVKGAQPTGASLSSFNDTAYTSYRLRSAYNSPVSVENVFKYTTSLKELLSYRRRKVMIGDSTTIFWAERPALLEHLTEDIFAEGPPPKPEADPEDKQRAEQVRAFLTQLRDGHSHGEAFDRDSDVGFYVLGVAAPALSRISVRLWVDTTIGEMQRRLAQHLKNTYLANADEDDPPLVIRRIVQATGRAEFKKGQFQRYDEKSVSPLLAGAIARAILTSNPYPRLLLGTILNRLRTDRFFSRERLACVKACLVRNFNLEAPVSLNVEHPSPAYHCGRLLCLLDYIQGQAIGNVNAGMVKKFYSVASVQPFAIFGRLVALTTKAHLPKLDRADTPGFAQFCERHLRQIMSKVGDRFPRILSLEEQGEFALGFYQQKDELPDTPPRYPVKTVRGEQVRSKSEALIANALHARGVDYRYELPFSVPGHRLVKPDFTVVGKVPADTIYIEHLGLSDLPKYIIRWEEKLGAYRSGGVLPESEGGGPEGTLVTFSETKASGIDTRAIDEKLRALFPPDSAQEGAQ